jgi:hypothetical protein
MVSFRFVAQQTIHSTGHCADANLMDYFVHLRLLEQHSKGPTEPCMIELLAETETFCTTHSIGS